MCFLALLHKFPVQLKVLAKSYLIWFFHQSLNAMNYEALIRIMKF